MLPHKTSLTCSFLYIGLYYYSGTNCHHSHIPDDGVFLRMPLGVLDEDFGVPGVAAWADSLAARYM